MIFEHKSVLLMETVDSLNVKPDGIYVDGTLGGGGDPLLHPLLPPSAHCAGLTEAKIPPITGAIL